ncbi:MAG: hypothetical protein F6K04_02375 [Leptolyngbya sp. SIO4C5]|nr:hypothetical protein [Leptolyngbya sp. SIO4C5]
MSISTFVQTPSLQPAQNDWGDWFERLSQRDRFQLIELLAFAAQELETDGEVSLAALPYDVWDCGKVEMEAFLCLLDKDLSSFSEIAALISGISAGLGGLVLSRHL